VAVKRALSDYLPLPRIAKHGERFELEGNGPKSVGRVRSFFGNFGILVRAYAYILSLGGDGLEDASRMALLNANYIRKKLEKSYHLAYNEPCMHECIFTDRVQQRSGVTTLDIAKRLLDYGHHPPTIYFPLVVSGALMIEPTETETPETLDSFIDAMLAIAQEAKDDPELVKKRPIRRRCAGSTKRGRAQAGAALGAALGRRRIVNLFHQGFCSHRLKR
jgi:Glycine cleavage system protein P (pyridoxal-binding), C-terminal domain